MIRGACLLPLHVFILSLLTPKQFWYRLLILGDAKIKWGSVWKQHPDSVWQFSGFKVKSPSRNWTAVDDYVLRMSGTILFQMKTFPELFRDILASQQAPPSPAPTHVQSSLAPQTPTMRNHFHRLAMKLLPSPSKICVISQKLVTFCCLMNSITSMWYSLYNPFFKCY